MDDTVQLPPKRRRSSILIRRSFGPPISNAEPSVNAASNTTANEIFELQTPIALDQNAEEEGQLQSYIKDLTVEKNAWKSLRAERKLLRNPEKRINTPLQLSWDTAHEFLSEEDIALLKNVPPYEKIYESYDRLVKETALLRNKYDRCSNLASAIHRLVQSRFDVIKKDIGEYSEKNLDLQQVS